MAEITRKRTGELLRALFDILMPLPEGLRANKALEMLAGTDELAERQRLWGMMEADLDELDQLIDTSLTYARFERDAPEAHFSSVRFADWLTEEVESVRLLGRTLNVTVDT